MMKFSYSGKLERWVVRNRFKPTIMRGDGSSSTPTLESPARFRHV